MTYYPPSRTKTNGRTLAHRGVVWEYGFSVTPDAPRNVEPARTTPLAQRSYEVTFHTDGRLLDFTRGAWHLSAAERPPRPLLKFSSGWDVFGFASAGAAVHWPLCRAALPGRKEKLLPCASV